MSFISEGISNLPGSPVTSVDVSNPDFLIIKNEQDCTAVLKDNKRLYNQAKQDGGYGPTREWKRVASIPPIILEKWYKEDGIRWWDSEDAHLLARKLDDPDWLFLRTAPGVISRRPGKRRMYKASTGGVIRGQLART